MTKLRGHHLVCLHFFGGEGYDSTFVENLKRVISHAEKEGVTVCSGADEVCSPCPYLIGVTCRDEAEIKKMDASALELLHLVPGQEVSWDAVRGKLHELFEAWYDTYCIDCGWQDACSRDPLFRELTLTAR
ncbi:MAG: DUF1284 domain-containing protein [Deltaproteobacteria bacterium]|nr:DUF1284 domain-containing protein [Deltaproteobacteria bacterium]NIS77132.1 DUF1284 domain-containing protein [Deltaproteobacteria bacterium]